MNSLKSFFNSNTFYFIITACSFCVILTLTTYNYILKPQKEQQITYNQEQQITKIKFSCKKIDFGNVSNDTILKAKYYIYNTGNSKLKILSVNPDCSCTKYFLSKDSVSAGDSTLLELIYDTNNRFGEQELFTILEMNTPEKLHMLSFKLNIPN